MQKTRAQLVAAADRVLVGCRREFAQAFAQRLLAPGQPVAFGSRGAVVYWREADGRLGWARLCAYGHPSGGRPPQPLVPRVHVRDTPERIPARVLRDLRIDPGKVPSDRFLQPSTLRHLELSCLPGEITAAAHLAADRVLVDLGLLDRDAFRVPDVFSGPREDFLRTSYEWTEGAKGLWDAWIAEARELEEKWKRLRGTVPR